MERSRRPRTHKPVWVLFPVALAGFFALPPQGGAEPKPRYEFADLKALENAFTDLAEQVRPSVVAIRCYQLRNTAERESLVKVPIAQGSGFIISAEGHIATNRHVLEDADVITATLNDGRYYEATLREKDTRSDLAVLKIEANNLTPVKWGDLSRVRVNQWAFACGNPFGLANNSGDSSITVGVVSALGRQMTHRIAADSKHQYYGNLIETSAAINPGNSGGPLFNVDGEVIGVVTAIETSTGVNEGLGFAIPIDQNTRQILTTLSEGKQIRYGFLGVSVNDLESPATRRVVDTQPTRGARIVQIDPANGPAGAAGLRPDDIVIEINGVAIRDTDHLVRMVGFTPVGSNVDVTYIRDSVKHRVSVTVGDRFDLLTAKAEE